jgi:spore coat polysaccharide biosynthesis protein SpsF
MKTVAIVQARMGSTRLPGKVLKQLEGHSVLAHVLSRLKAVKTIDAIVVATTDAPLDDPIVSEAEYLGVHCFRGSEQDVLSRYYGAAVSVNAEVVVRITSDCPIIDPTVIEEVIRVHQKENVDYCSSVLERSFPRGLDTEVFTFAALVEAHGNALKPEQREHVTPYLYQNPQLFKLAGVRNEVDYSKYRWTLDTIEDWQLITEIYRHLYAQNSLFSWRVVLDLMNKYPHLADINAHIEQKKL